MKGWITRWAVAGLAAGLLGSLAYAQYRPPPAKTELAEEEEPFERSVDLKRFRKGNLHWDTQELMASGFNALHRDHEKILRELAELKAEVAKLKEGQE